MCVACKFKSRGVATSASGVSVRKASMSRAAGQTANEKQQSTSGSIQHAHSYITGMTTASATKRASGNHTAFCSGG